MADVRAIVGGAVTLSAPKDATPAGPVVGFIEQVGAIVPALILDGPDAAGKCDLAVASPVGSGNFMPVNFVRRDAVAYATDGTVGTWHNWSEKEMAAEAVAAKIAVVRADEAKRTGKAVVASTPAAYAVQSATTQKVDALAGQVTDLTTKFDNLTSLLERLVAGANASGGGGQAPDPEAKPSGGDD